MNSKVKVIANYLPQYHSIPENDRWWGNGYTDWNAVKDAKPLFKEHNQPRIPQNSNYYSLDEVEEVRKQALRAKEYGVSGFAIYHYWFSKDMNLLSKPSEIILNNKDMEIDFLFLWDNCTWKRTWSNVKHANDMAPNCDKLIQKNMQNNDGILAELKYGGMKEWKEHFDYLLPFFSDKRYIKLNNKPVFGFFQPQNDYDIILQMVQYWDILAKENGFEGVVCMSRDNYQGYELEYKFRYTPLVPIDVISYAKYKFKDIYTKKFKKIRFYDYDKCWKQIISEAKKSDSNTFLSGFVAFDDTPRRGKNGRVVKNFTVEKFSNYLSKLISISEEQNKEFVFLTAWNEWSEGAYLEPDEKYGNQYLEAVKNAVSRKF